MTLATLIQARASSSVTRQYSKHAEPEAAVLLRNEDAEVADLGHLSRSAIGISPCTGSSSLATGSTRFIAKSRAVSRMSSCSAVSISRRSARRRDPARGRCSGFPLRDRPARRSFPEHAITSFPLFCGSALELLDALLDGAEDRTPGRVLHLDPHAVAETKERRLRRAVLDRLDHAQLGNAGIPLAALRDRRPGPPPGSLFDTVPDPTMVPAESGRVFAAWATRRGKSKVMSMPALALPNACAVDRDEERQVDPASVPRRAELIRRHRDRRKGR